MYCCVKTGGLLGLSSYLASVEVDVSRGLPAFEMVGLPNNEIREARERIRVALRNTRVNLPAVRITVNLSPAGIQKSGTAFDLPVAVGIMAAWGLIHPQKLGNVWIAGELGLYGAVKPIRGALPLAMGALQSGHYDCILPLENFGEGLLASEGEARLMGVRTLQEAADYLNADEDGRARLRQRSLDEYRILQAGKDPGREVGGRGDSVGGEGGENAGRWDGAGTDLAEQRDSGEYDFSTVRRLQGAKRAAAVAAAGFHNLFFVGPPGAGKTMLARCIPSILPPMTERERREVSAIYSVAGKLGGKLIERRPFVSPHHTASAYALAGGGLALRPGMVSLAHRGILFLDEMAEFRRSALDILRQPMEEGKIYLARGGSSCVYPADFMLVAASNPCPCGYFPDRNRCQCTENQVRRYQSRVSGPLLDRIDISCAVEAVPVASFWERAQSAQEGSAYWRDRVMEARERQTRRYGGSGISGNGHLRAGDISRYCALNLSSQRYLEQAAEAMGFSARACHRILRVARTIADLEGSGDIQTIHLGEAIGYRRMGMMD